MASFHLTAQGEKYYAGDGVALLTTSPHHIPDLSKNLQKDAGWLV